MDPEQVESQSALGSSTPATMPSCKPLYHTNPVAAEAEAMEVKVPLVDDQCNVVAGGTANANVGVPPEGHSYEMQVKQ